MLPVDDFEPEPVRRMLVVGNPDDIPAGAARSAGGDRPRLGKPSPMAGIERFAFYEAAQQAFAVVQCGDPRPYGCFLIRKGVIAGPRP